MLLQVVSELSNRGESVGRLDGFGVVGNDDGLASLEGDNALFALVRLSVLAPTGSALGAYLLCLERIFA